MGIIYDPSDSQALISAMQSNIATGQEMTDAMNRACQQLTTALSGHTLSGAAYTAGNGLFKELVIPTISKTSSALDDLKSQLSQYQNAANAAGNELLDEDKLNQQLQALQAQQAALGNQINYYGILAGTYSEGNNNGLHAMYSNFQQESRNQLNTTEEDIQKVQDKLKRLHTFNDTVNGLFKDSLNELQTIMGGVVFLKDVQFDSSGHAKLSAKSNENIPSNVIKWIKANAAGVAGVLGNGETAGDILKDVVGKGVQKFGGLMTTLEGVAGPDGDKSFVMVDPNGVGQTIAEDGSSLMKYGKYAGRGFMAAGFAFGMYDDMVDEHKTFGEAVVHNGASLAVGVGASELASAAIGAVLVSNPVGWGAIVVGGAAIGIGVGATWLFDKAYNSNFGGLKDGLDDVGKGVDSTVKDVGQAVKSAANALNPFKWSW